MVMRVCLIILASANDPAAAAQESLRSIEFFLKETLKEG